MPVRCKATRNSRNQSCPRPDAPTAEEEYANVYDVLGFFLQLAQMIPIISALLGSLIANSWLARALAALCFVVAWLGTRHLAARNERRRVGSQAGCAGHCAQSPVPLRPEAGVVHRVRVLAGQYIAHCSCRTHASPQAGLTGAGAHVRHGQEPVRPEGVESRPGPLRTDLVEGRPQAPVFDGPEKRIEIN
jgi:hypothetical protein